MDKEKFLQSCRAIKECYGWKKSPLAYNSAVLWGVSCISEVPCCPITYVSNHTTGHIWGMLSVHTAAEELGLDNSLTHAIIEASDGKDLTSPLRAELETIFVNENRLEDEKLLEVKS